MEGKYWRKKRGNKNESGKNRVRRENTGEGKEEGRRKEIGKYLLEKDEGNTKAYK